MHVLFDRLAGLAVGIAQLLEHGLLGASFAPPRSRTCVQQQVVHQADLPTDG